MVKFKVGDKVMITNVRGVMFAKDYFKDGDVTEVYNVDSYSDGTQTIDVLVPQNKVDAATDYIDGKPTLYITSEEFPYIAKMLPDNKEVPRRR